MWRGSLKNDETVLMHEPPTVAVLMGGPSQEHDISLKSGHGVAAALAQGPWHVESIVIPRDVTIKQACDMTRRALQHAHADVAFLALHGAFGEDGTIQQLCEELHLAYTGSDPTASRLGMDKVASRTRFQHVGLSVPRWHLVDPHTHIAAFPIPLAYPVVVKPISQGSSVGVSIVHHEQELPTALALAGQYGSPVLVEEFVKGKEVTVGVLGEEPLPVIEIRPQQQFFNFAAKYTAGQTEYLVPAPLPAEVTTRIQGVGLAAHRALHCRHLSRTDIMLSEQGVPVVLEVNTIPGFTPTSLLPKSAACVGVSYEQLCEQLVLMALHDSPAMAKSP